jgi:hypothetical protein
VHLVDSPLALTSPSIARTIPTAVSITTPTNAPRISPAEAASPFATSKVPVAAEGPLLGTDLVGDPAASPAAGFVGSTLSSALITDADKVPVAHTTPDHLGLLGSTGTALPDQRGLVEPPNAPVNNPRPLTSLALTFPGVTIDLLRLLNSASADSGAAAVRAYQVGTYDDLKVLSGVGDQLDIHHVPPGKPAGQVIPGYSYSDAPVIALPAEEHGLIPNRKGEFTGTPEDLLSRDLENLREFTNAPESSIQQLRDLVTRTYPGSFEGV